MASCQNSILIITLFAIALCCPGIGWSQNNFSYDLEKVAEKYDLISTDINCIFQDNFGYLWLGTKAGVSRFDGLQFENFTFTQGKSVAEIHDIVQTADGVIWAGGANGLYFYREGAFQKAESISQVITSLHLTKNGKMLIGGLLFVPFGCDSLQLDSLINQLEIHVVPLVDGQDWQKKSHFTRVWDITSDVVGNIYLGLDNQLVLIKDGVMDVIWEDHFQKILISQIVAFSPDSIYWGSESTGLYFGSKDNFSLIETSATYVSHVTDSTIYFLSALHLLKVDKTGISIVYDFTEHFNLYFKDLLLDREGNIWIGTEGNLLKLTPKIFQNWTVDEFPLLEANFSIEELRTGQMIIGSSREKILEIVDDTVRLFDKISVPHNSVTEAVYEDARGHLWYGSTMGGIVWKGNGSQVNFGVEDGLFDTEILFFRMMSDGHLWCGGYNGICRIKGEQESFQFESFSFPRNNVDVPLFLDMITSPEGTYWAISDNGLYHFREDSLLPFTLDLDQDLPLISGVTQVKDRTFYLSTQGGGVWKMVFNSRNEPELTRKYVKENGLISDVALNVHVDTSSTIWVFYQNGISRLDSVNGGFKIRNYTEEDGLVLAPTAKIKIKESNDGFMWVVKKSSISRFPLYSIYQNNTIPKTFIREVGLMGNDDITKYVLERSQISGVPQSILLPYNKNFIEFKFTSTSFSRPGKNMYRYRLEGLENTWSALTIAPTAVYRGLNPGSYKFTVQAFNGDGLPGEVSAPISLTVLKPFYARWWAITSYVGLGFLVFYFGYNYHLDKRRKEEESKRLKELDRVKNNLYTNITHEFRTPLTLILGHLEELEEKLECIEDKKILKNVKENSWRLLKMVNDILELSKLEGDGVKLDLQQDDLVAHLHYIVNSFHALAHSRQITMSFKSSEPELMMDFDHERVSSILVNLISNALKATSEGGNITVELLRLSGTNEPLAGIVVSDDGIGISEEDLPFVFEKYYQVEKDGLGQNGTGIGLAIVRELVEQMQGSVSVESGEKGTIFRVLLPIARNVPLNERPNGKIENELYEFNPATGERPLVLLIEDQRDIANYIGKIISREFDVLYASAGIEGLSLANDRMPDLVVSDVMMPDIDGFEVCHQLKSDFKTDHIPVILLTAKAGQMNRNYGISMGADAYLIKPFSRDELLFRIRQLIEVRNRLSEKYTSGMISTTVLEKEDKQSQFLALVIKHILINIGDAGFGAIQLANELAMSESQLYRKLKATSGRSTAIFIRSIRLEEAKKLLVAGDLPVSEAAYSTGFNDPSWFSRAFKKEFGVAPSQVRQNIEE